VKYIVAIALALCACGSKKKQKRTGDAAPVIVVKAPVFDGGVPGSVEEIEPNDGADVATPIAIGATARGKIEPETDADYYRIDVTEASALSVLTNMVDADLTVDIEDGSGTIIARSDRGGARIREGVPNLAVSPGRYTAIVRKKPPPPVKKPKPKKGHPPPAGGQPGGSPAAGSAPAVPPVAYEIAVALVQPAANTEREPDDDRGTANDLIVGDQAQGLIGWTGDVDIWKLSVEALSAKNSIEIEVGAVDGVALSLELADGVGAPLLARKAPRGQPLVVKNVLPVVPSGAPPFHYLTIRGDKSNPETHYTLRVTAGSVEPEQEIEPDDTAEKPMPFPSDRTRLDGTWSAGDTDYYAIAADVNPRTVDVDVAPSEVDLAVDLLIDGKVIAKSETPGKGQKEKLTAQIPASAKALVRVRAAADATGQGTYELQIREQ
jgi:hypothetical protein